MHRCHLLVVTSNSLLANSRELHGYWGEPGQYSQRMISSDPTKGLTDRVWVLNSLHTLIARLLQELDLPLGKSRVNHYLAESWRSGQSLGNTRQSLQTAVVMVNFIIERESSDEVQVWRELASMLESVRLSMEMLPISFEEAVKEGDGHKDVLVLREKLADVQKQVNASAGHLEIALGFNASDGD